MNNYIYTLDNILLSDNVIDNFYNEYDNNKEFKLWLNILLPEIDACRYQKQRTVWHKYNVLDHILYSITEMNKLSINYSLKIRRMLAYIMLLHDIGKPEAHFIKIINNEEADSFYGHHIHSVRIAERVLAKFNFEKKEIKEMLILIEKHDMFIPLRLEKTHDKILLDEEYINNLFMELNNYGDARALMKYLVLIGKSDNLSQNENMVGYSLRVIEKFSKMIEKI